MKSRIPRFQPRTIGDVYRWFAEMDANDDLFHPDDPAETILNPDGTRAFTDDEAAILNKTIEGMRIRFGDPLYEVGSLFFTHRVWGVWS